MAVTLLGAAAITVALPLVVALNWYPPYRDDALGIDSTSRTVEYRLPADVILVERTTSMCVRATRFVRLLREDEPRPRGTYRTHGSESKTEWGRSLVEPQEAVVTTAKSPLPSWLSVSLEKPYALVASYGWPFDAVCCTVTGTYTQSEMLGGTLHDARQLVTEPQLFRTYYGYWPLRTVKGFYRADLPCGNLPTRWLWQGAIGNLLVMAGLMNGLVFLRRFMPRMWRHIRGRCDQCGYSRSGLASSVCPECGGCLMQ